MAKRRKKKQTDPVAAFVIGRTMFKQALAHVAALEASVHGIRDVTHQLVGLLGLKQRQSDSAKRAVGTRKANEAAAAGQAELDRFDLKDDLAGHNGTEPQPEGGK